MCNDLTLIVDFGPDWLLTTYSKVSLIALFSAAEQSSSGATVVSSEVDSTPLGV